MKIQKLSLSAVKNVLSRAELKKITAGSGDVYYCCACELRFEGPAVGYYLTQNSDCGQYCAPLYPPTGTGYETNPVYCNE